MAFNPTHRSKNYIFLTAIVGLLLSIITGCAGGINLPGIKSPTQVEPPVKPEAQIPLGTVAFHVTVPSGTSAGTITLEILDEVTGLALNPKRYAMTAGDADTYTVDIPIAIGSLIKYRYIRTGDLTAVEYTGSGQQVRYRLFQVDGPSTVQDIVAGWTDAHYAGPVGRIMGQVITQDTNEPFPSVLVSAGGVQTFTSSDGSFELEGLPPGTHNLVAASVDGAFLPFQQGAVVAENAVTPAPIHVQLAKKVKVTFVAQIPASDIKGLPLRLVGSSYGLGNTFGDLQGGTNVVASRAPIMPMIADNIYSLTLELPVGFDLRYKYTLGDGFWNAEHYANGSFRIRQLIVPANDVTLTDIVEGWKTGAKAPVTFSVTVPVSTPAEDTISIQFNPFGWTAPIPMWPLGNNQWLYVLNGPLDLFGSLSYRYCRNDQCGVADDSLTHDITSQGKSVTLTNDGQSIQDTVETWANWSETTVSTTIIAPEITPVGNQFFAGVELNPNYNPLWQPHYPNALQNIKSIGSNWVVFSPGWSYVQANPPAIATVGGRDELWGDLTAQIRYADTAGLKSALYPRLQSDLLPGGIWDAGNLDGAWWSTWFAEYRTFILNFADLAAQTQAGMLILGGPDITPALPGGILSSGEPSNVPENAAVLWQGLITELRGRYTGEIAWALPFPQNATPLPGWLNEVDALYVLFSPSLTATPQPAQDELETAIANFLDSELQSVATETGKPVILALEYPSANGAASGCIQISDRCLPFDLLNQPVPDLPGVTLNLQEQTDIYNAAFNAAVGRSWITGIVARGYYPAAALRDSSASIHGKPAADVIWYWFPKLLGQ